MKQPINYGSEGNRAVGYVRDSGDKTSLDRQREQISRWCREHGHELVACYPEEAPAGGDSMEERPALTSLLEDAGHGQFDAVVVASLDCWARNSRVQRRTLLMLGRCEVGFASVREDINLTTPEGHLLLAIMGAILPLDRGDAGEEAGR